MKGLPLLWGLVGVGVGVGIRALNVGLAGTLRLEPGRGPLRTYGPPATAGLVLAALGWRLGDDWPLLLLRSLWASVLVQIIWFDAEHHLILDRVTIPAVVAALGFSWITPDLTWQSSLIAGAGTGLLFLAAAVVGGAIYRGEVLGLGDVKLAAFLGLILGLRSAPSAILAGLLVAAATALLLVACRLRQMRDRIPFGPFLAAGGLLALMAAGRT